MGFPVVTMYDNGRINAIYFASWKPQSGLEYGFDVHGNVSNAAMCTNTCDNCGGHGGWSNMPAPSLWSILHIEFGDVANVRCSAEMTCATPRESFPAVICCPPSSSQ